MSDLIDRQKVIDICNRAIDLLNGELGTGAMTAVRDWVVNLPSAQPEQTDCEYCHEDSDGYVRPIEKNSHAWLIRQGRTIKLHICFKGEHRECDILFCPMCGRRFACEMRQKGK